MTNSPSEENNPWKEIQGKYTWYESKLKETPKIFLKLLPPDKYASEIEVLDPEVVTTKNPQ